MKLPKYVQNAIELLENAGYEAVVVGGAIRDYLLNIKPNDYDISTNALPSEVKKVFEKFYTLDTGIKHGTITVFINHRQIEITTYRNEEDYEDYRHPKKVVFVRDLKSDLSRRDFTINALCFNKHIIDHVGGIKDLNNKILRAIGEAKQRFQEDPLRILRALRFASTLGFEIEEATEKAMFEYKGLIEKVSKERINIEFNKLILGINARKVINRYLIIINNFIPELSDIDLNLKALNYLDDVTLKISMLLLNLDSKECFEILKRLKYSNSVIKEVCFYVENFNMELVNDEQAITKSLSIYNYHELKYIIKLKKAYNMALEGDNKNLNDIEETLDIVYKKKDCFRVKDLKISGNELLKIGFHEGVIIRLVLEKLLGEVLEGRIVNKKESLMKEAKKLFNDNYFG